MRCASGAGKVSKRPVMLERLSITTRIRSRPERDIGKIAHARQQGAITPIFVIVTFGLTWLARDRLAHFTNQLGWAFIEANHRMLWIGFFGIKVENILHTGDISAVHLRNAPHIPAATASGRPRPNAGAPSRATALHAPSD